MSKVSRRPRAGRSSGAARRRASAQRRNRNRVALAGIAIAAVALAGALVGLHVASRSGAGGSTGSSGSGAPNLPVGTKAPNAAFTTLGGTTETVAALHGRPVLIWFVTTWCSSCQAGTEAMAQHIATLAAERVRVVEVENSADLGQPGPSIGAFGRTLAGDAFSNPDWEFGEASATLTHTYNPKAYLDIYYLINAAGQITYVNSSPGSTMPQLLSAARALS